MSPSDPTREELSRELEALRAENALLRAEQKTKAAPAPLRRGLSCDALAQPHGASPMPAVCLLREAVRDIVLVVDADDGRILDANDAAHTGYGYSHEELLSLTIRDLRAPDTRDATPGQMAQAATGGLLFETNHVRKDATTFPVEVSSRGAVFQGTRTLVSVVRDVTERKARDAALERLTRLYAALSQVNQGIVRVTSREELFEEMCRVLVEYAHFRMAWIGLPDPDTRLLVPAARWGDHRGYLGAVRVSADDGPEGQGPSGTAFREGHIYVCNDFFSDPRTVPWRDAASRLGYPSLAAVPVRLRGAVTAVLTVYAAETGFFGDREVELLEQVARDISYGLERLEEEARRRQAEKEVRQWADAFRHCGHGIAMGDPATGRLIACNPAFAEMRGATVAELVGKTILSLYPPSERPRIESLLAEADREGKVRFEAVGMRADGSDFPIQMDVVSVGAPEGNPLYRVATAIDLTERLELEKQFLDAQKMEAVGTLAGGIAHDFNNILTPILAYSELALQELPSGHPVHSDLSQILTAAERATELVKQILDLSRRDDDRPAAVDLALLLKEVAKFVRASLPTTIEIRTAVDPACGPVAADLSRLHQVLMNLCTNARDAMAEKGGVLTLSLEPAAGERVRLLVEDTGSGIPPEVAKRIFDPYFTTKPKGKGTGLGLATVRAIVTATGGEVAVHSEPGRGTTFEVLLPKAQGETASEGGPHDLPRGNQRHVLVVDDEPAIAEVVRSMLVALGYRATACTSSAEALAAFRAAPRSFDAVFTDYTMPGLTGIDLALALAQVRPEVPVVLGTGFSEALTDEFLRKSGLKGFVLKPYTLQKVAEVVRDALTPAG